MSGLTSEVLTSILEQPTEKCRIDFTWGYGEDFYVDNHEILAELAKFSQEKHTVQPAAWKLLQELLRKWSNSLAIIKKVLYTYAAVPATQPLSLDYITILTPDDYKDNRRRLSLGVKVIDSKEGDNPLSLTGHDSRLNVFRLCICFVTSYRMLYCRILFTFSTVERGQKCTTGEIESSKTGIKTYTKKLLDLVDSELYTKQQKDAFLSKSKLEKLDLDPYSRSNDRGTPEVDPLAQFTATGTSSDGASKTGNRVRRQSTERATTSSASSASSPTEKDVHYSSLQLIPADKVGRTGSGFHDLMLGSPHQVEPVRRNPVLADPREVSPSTHATSEPETDAIELCEIGFINDGKALVIEKDKTLHGVENWSGVKKTSLAKVAQNKDPKKLLKKQEFLEFASKRNENAREVANSFSLVEKIFRTPPYTIQHVDEAISLNRDPTDSSLVNVLHSDKSRKLLHDLLHQSLENVVPEDAESLRRWKDSWVGQISPEHADRLKMRVQYIDMRKRRFHRVYTSKASEDSKGAIMKKRDEVVWYLKLYVELEPSKAAGPLAAEILEQSSTGAASNVSSTCVQPGYQGLGSALARQSPGPARGRPIESGAPRHAGLKASSRTLKRASRVAPYQNRPRDAQRPIPALKKSSSGQQGRAQSISADRAPRNVIEARYSSTAGVYRDSMHPNTGPSLALYSQSQSDPMKFRPVTTSHTTSTNPNPISNPMSLSTILNDPDPSRRD